MIEVSQPDATLVVGSQVREQGVGLVGPELEALQLLSGEAKGFVAGKLGWHRP